MCHSSSPCMCSANEPHGSGSCSIFNLAKLYSFLQNRHATLHVQVHVRSVSWMRLQPPCRLASALPCASRQESLLGSAGQGESLRLSPPAPLAPPPAPGLHLRAPSQPPLACLLPGKRALCQPPARRKQLMPHPSGPQAPGAEARMLHTSPLRRLLELPAQRQQMHVEGQPRLPL